MRLSILAYVLAILTVVSCENPPGEKVVRRQSEILQDTVGTMKSNMAVDASDYSFYHQYYVPIYSDIYVDDIAPKVLLAATLSIRNTSFTDTLTIMAIDYYDTDGSLVRPYIDSDITVGPMGTKSYVLQKQDDTGGRGANFIVEISSTSEDVNPLVQAIMVGEYKNKGFAFPTDSYIIK